jgi:hypothetical protein
MYVFANQNKSFHAGDTPYIFLSASRCISDFNIDSVFQKLLLSQYKTGNDFFSSQSRWKKKLENFPVVPICFY